MTPIFIFVTSDGKLWASVNPGDTPPGTVLATFRVTSGTGLKQIGTLSGNSGSYSVAGGTGKFGTELHS